MASSPSLYIHSIDNLNQSNGLERTNSVLMNPKFLSLFWPSPWAYIQSPTQYPYLNVTTDISNLTCSKLNSQSPFKTCSSHNLPTSVNGNAILPVDQDKVLESICNYEFSLSNVTIILKKTQQFTVSFTCSCYISADCGLFHVFFAPGSRLKE